MNKKIIRGAIFYADLDPIVGCEQNGIRPVLIIQNDIGNKYSSTVIIAPISTKKKLNLPTHILINELRSNSIIMLEQIRVIDKKRLYEFVDMLTESEMQEVDQAIAISLGLK